MREVGWVVAGTSLRLVNTNLQYSSNNKCEESHFSHPNSSMYAHCIGHCKKCAVCVLEYVIYSHLQKSLT